MTRINKKHTGGGPARTGAPELSTAGTWITIIYSRHTYLAQKWGQRPGTRTPSVAYKWGFS